ncbi:MAG TPA: hypothetical protein VN408_16000 [Actinoplanes sp.]|nr:hypothetical protein [Actinoplanes sp.]
MTRYPYRRIGAFLLLILVLVTAVLVPAGRHPHSVAPAGATAAVEHVHDAGTETVSGVVAPRGPAVTPVTMITVTRAEAPVRPVRPLIAHVDLRLPGVLRV